MFIDETDIYDMRGYYNTSYRLVGYLIRCNTNVGQTVYSCVEPQGVPPRVYFCCKTIFHENSM